MFSVEQHKVNEHIREYTIYGSNGAGVMDLVVGKYHEEPHGYFVDIRCEKEAAITEIKDIMLGVSVQFNAEAEVGFADNEYHKNQYSYELRLPVKAPDNADITEATQEANFKGCVKKLLNELQDRQLISYSVLAEINDYEKTSSSSREI